MTELTLYLGADKKYYVMTPVPTWHRFDTKLEALAFADGWRNASIDPIKVTDTTDNNSEGCPCCGYNWRYD